MPTAARRRATTPSESIVDLNYISEPLRRFAVPIESLTPDPENPRIHDQLNMEAITASLREFGQQIPIIVQQDGMIVRVGNGRLQAAKDIGWTHIAAIVTDQPESIAKAFGIADNRTGELARWDRAELAKLLDDLQDEAPSLLASVGFEMREIEAMITRYLPDEDAPGGQASNGTQPGPSGVNTGASGPEGNGEPPVAFGNPSATMRYVNLTFTAEDYDKYVDAVTFFKERYDTTITPDALLKAMIEYKESLQ